MSYRKQTNGFTLKELLVVHVIIIMLIPIIISAVMGANEKSRQSKCKANLDQLGKSLKLYTIDFGRGVRFPGTYGAGFLTALYQEKILQEGRYYLCPSTNDNNIGIDLGKIKNADKVNENYVSYAGRINTDQAYYPGIFKP